MQHSLPQKRYAAQFASRSIYGTACFSIYGSDKRQGHFTGGAHICGELLNYYLNCYFLPCQYIAPFHFQSLNCLYAPNLVSYIPRSHFPDLITYKLILWSFTQHVHHYARHRPLLNFVTLHCLCVVYTHPVQSSHSVVVFHRINTSHSYTLKSGIRCLYFYCCSEVKFLQDHLQLSPIHPLYTKVVQKGLANGRSTAFKCTMKIVSTYFVLVSQYLYFIITSF